MSNWALSIKAFLQQEKKKGNLVSDNRELSKQCDQWAGAPSTGTLLKHQGQCTKSVCHPYSGS